MSPAHRRPRRLSPVGVLGELLLTAGVLLVLFLVWQLWWTDVMAEQEQSGILDGLHQEWGEIDEDEGIAAPQEGPAPVPAAPQDTMVWATMHVPAFDRPEFPLAEGVDMEQVLNVKGAGHYPGTALPGELGNVAVAGHRNTYGRVFEDIGRLEAGDPILIETADAFYVYEVTETLIVQPEDVEVIAPTPGRPGVEPTQQMLTLTACHPMFSARERIIVHAEFAYWTDRADGLPKPLATADEDPADGAADENAADGAAGAAQEEVR